MDLSFDTFLERNDVFASILSRLVFRINHNFIFVDFPAKYGSFRLHSRDETGGGGSRCKIFPPEFQLDMLLKVLCQLFLEGYMCHMQSKHKIALGVCQRRVKTNMFLLKNVVLDFEKVLLVY